MLAAQTPTLAQLHDERAEVHEVLRERTLPIAFQPVVSRVADGTWTVTGVEALVRPPFGAAHAWTTASFLDAAARHSAMDALFEHVLDYGLAQIQEWDSLGLQLRLAVNLHAEALGDARLARTVGDALARHRVRAERLLLEIGERTPIADLDRSELSITCLRALGVRLAIDDFGAGLGSLTRVDLIECDELKLDRALVTGLEHSAELRRAVANAVAHGHARCLKICAEGVETAATLELVGALGCDRAQGFHIGPAVAAADVAALAYAWDAATAH